jgi:hypothetical protein
MSLFRRKKDNTIPRRRLEADVDVKVDLSDNFKRNQTISGALSSVTPRQKTHHLAIKRRKVLTIFLIVLMVALTIWLLIINMTAKVSVSVIGSISSSKNIDKSSYEKVIQDYLDANPIGRLRFFLDQNTLRSYLVNKMPEVENISQAGTDGLGVSVFRIAMRKPVAGWMINNKQYFVDANGVSFNLNYFNDPSVQIIDQNGVSLQSGDVVVSQRFLSFVGLTVAQATNNGYTVIQAILPSGTTRELELRIKEGDYLVKLSIDRPVGEQIEDMVVALKYFISKGQKPQYIDIRVSGKAFYK